MGSIPLTSQFLMLMKSELTCHQCSQIKIGTQLSFCKAKNWNFRWVLPILIKIKSLLLINGKAPIFRKISITNQDS